MGYRSDVGLCLTVAGKQVLDTTLAGAAGSNPHFTEIKNLVDHAETRTDADSGTVTYLWRNLKWYVGYDDVKFVENILSTLEDSVYLFIRGVDPMTTPNTGAAFGRIRWACVWCEVLLSIDSAAA